MWYEIQKGFSDVLDSFIRPHLIVFPELTLPHGYEGKLKALAMSAKAVVIIGQDFIKLAHGVKNQGLIVIMRDF